MLSSLRLVKSFGSSIVGLKINCVKMSSLTKQDVGRYSRQLLINEIGKEGQLKLKATSVLIVGCGGLGSPCSYYLAAAGIGKIGLVDHDKVEISNLHRQIVHSEATLGMEKSVSAKKSLESLNSSVEYQTISHRLTRSNAVEIIENYDIIVDGSDNAPTRYMVSDASCVAGKPLVSGAALKFDGQLTTYHYDENTPCYRCLFPSPPNPNTVTNCSDGGVLGVIPGIIGSLQALEVIKIALGKRPSYAGKMLLFDGLGGEFRDIVIRNRQKDCIACGDNPTITRDLIDYEQFCGTPLCDQSQSLKILAPEERISCHDYKKILDQNEPHLLIDVRPALQANIVKLDNAINIPLDQLVRGDGLQRIEDLADSGPEPIKKIYFICRKGNASQQACRFAQETLGQSYELKDIVGGMTSWSNEVDSSVPVY
ncbi:ubiquitin-like activating enzyme 4 [Brevipalpus obovatus]|uniref:ubiquitin-like activating enzyme 4 n=1 Tax=Brevipalpus obovatus TaxID=246614 RepID=UPI003D9F61A6